MYVCICHGVTDNEVNAEIALGARTVGEIGDRCDAGTGCGTCVDKLEWLLDRAAERRAVGCCGRGCGAGCEPGRLAGGVPAAGTGRRGA